MGSVVLEEVPPKDTFTGEIRVAARIIEFISSGLYESPAACLKELINNSYDADATVVHIFVKPDADRIVIEDNGIGMNREEFQRHFERISESHKRDASDRTNKDRPKIGKIGIGFVAANELCDVLEIYSTQRGSADLLHITIDFGRLREEPAEARRKGEDEFVQGDYTGEILEARKNDHYTRLFLTGVRQHAQPILAGAGKHMLRQPRSLYGLRPESIVKRLQSDSVKAWNDFDSYSETMLRVGLNVPVKYAPGWITRELRKPMVTQIEKEAQELDFSVIYDGTDLRKPTILNPTNSALLQPFEFEGLEVSARGYFYGQHGVIKPWDLNGLLLRIRHAAVGSYDRSFWEYPTSLYTLFQRWVSVEIWADDRMEDAMNIDRQTLRVTHPAYVELREAIHQQLEEFFRRMRSEIHGGAAKSRQQQRTAHELNSIRSVVRERVSELGEATSRDVERAWTDVVKAGKAKAATNKMSIAEMYDLVIDVAEETLDRRSLRRFVQALTRKLTQ